MDCDNNTHLFERTLYLANYVHPTNKEMCMGVNANDNRVCGMYTTPKKTINKEAQIRNGINTHINQNCTSARPNSYNYRQQGATLRKVKEVMNLKGHSIGMEHLRESFDRHNGYTPSNNSGIDTRQGMIDKHRGEYNKSKNCPISRKSYGSYGVCV